jgi:hypothetical protein
MTYQSVTLETSKPTNHVIHAIGTCFEECACYRGCNKKQLSVVLKNVHVTEAVIKTVVKLKRDFIID